MTKTSVKWVGAVAVLLFAAVIVVPFAHAAAQDMEPIRIELPKPSFALNGPGKIVSDNLEPTTGKKRAPFMAPKGVTNVAKGKKATASDMQPVIGELKMVTDGDKEADNGSFIEFGPGKTWVQVDLEAEFEIFAIVVWHYHSKWQIYRDFIVQVSDDPDFVKDVTTVFNNDHDNSYGLGTGKDKEYIETNDGKLVDAKGVRGHYVRVHSNGTTSNDMNHMIEIEVYGKPVA